MCVAFSPYGTRLVSGGKDQTARLWDVTTDKELATLQGKSQVRSLCFSADGSVNLWNLDFDALPIMEKRS
jgi:WD40 repeat protein